MAISLPEQSHYCKYQAVGAKPALAVGGNCRGTPCIHLWRLGLASMPPTSPPTAPDRQGLEWLAWQMVLVWLKQEARKRFVCAIKKQYFENRGYNLLSLNPFSMNSGFANLKPALV